jgi:hypothetical protein
MRLWAVSLAFFACMTFASPAFPWGHEGHQLVGSIADQLLEGHPAKQQVEKFLGFDLRAAAVWPDCVRSVVQNDDGTFAFKIDPQHPEYTAPCPPFETPSEKARMEDYAKRNWTNCTYIPKHGCHETYHFADVPSQRGAYVLGYAGTNKHDIVSAINAAIAVLKGQPSPEPFSIKDEKEALFLLAHFVGDLHQPLHVGSVYLDENGNRLNPASPAEVDESTETSGGNFLFFGGEKLHTAWDAIPGDLGDTASKAMVDRAKAILPTPGDCNGWAARWASESVVASQRAFAGLTFTKNGARHWTVRFADRDAYFKDADALKREQLAKAGAHLAELLKAIWP